MDKRDPEYRKKLRKIRVRRNRDEKKKRREGKNEENVSPVSPLTIIKEKRQIDVHKLKRELEKDIAPLMCDEKISEGNVIEIEFPPQDIVKLTSEKKERANEDGCMEIEMFPQENYLFYIEIKEIVENTKNLFLVCVIENREIILDFTKFMSLLKTCKETKENKDGCDNCSLNQ